MDENIDADADADAEHMNKETELERNHCNSTVRGFGINYTGINV